MIGILDSGVGGLSVWRELYRIMPKQEYYYVSDAAHCPYGTKPIEYIVDRAEKITEFLIGEGAEILVVACNTATAAAIGDLRSKYPIPFVGIEPAIKPAATTSASGVVGVLATANTLKGSLYHNTLEKFASNVKVIERVGTGLVELIEQGITSGEEIDALLSLYIGDMIDAGADTIVLGCTHYPFIEESIRKITGPSVKIINPAPAVAAQAKRIADSLPSKNLNSKISSFYSTGELDTLKYLAKTIEPKLTDENFYNLYK